MARQRPGPRRVSRAALACSAAWVMSAFSGCAGRAGPPQPAAAAPPGTAALTCDDSMKAAFRRDEHTRIVLVKAFRRGEPLTLAASPSAPPAPAALNDLCLVKVVVGPGHPGSAGAPSTSAGIGIEVWLPAPSAWNERIRNLGGGGWSGDNQGSTTLIGNVAAAATAAAGYVVGTTDTGHAASHGDFVLREGAFSSGAFAMREDGGINSVLWHDFARRSLHELALVTKSLAQAYYRKAPKYAYWEGCSTGGRQGYKIAQEHPEDYDGYVIEAPALNWTRFITSELYPQVVIQRDLGGNLSNAQLAFVSAAAVSACDRVGGQHVGVILDPRQCRYDPTRDAAVLCRGAQGHGVAGNSPDASCVSTAQAQAINKIWYGQTADGRVPDPALDNASDATLSSSDHLWWGLSRGTNLQLLAGDRASPPFFGPVPIAADMVALESQDPTLATPSFANATGTGADGWKALTYAGLANAYRQGEALQRFFGHINTDNPDLTKLRDRGAKIVHLHGWGDPLITPAGSINYYTRMANAMGGFAEAQKFDRLFMVPGRGHCGGVGSVSGNAGPAADANSVPQPAAEQFFDAMVAWVEKQQAPESLVLASADGSVTWPVCPYPKKPTYGGSGPVTTASSYRCR
jgi:hypothetical protein